jgi:hypothetical protein
MAEAEAEQADLARFPGGLLINFGTVEAHDGMLAAGRHANQNCKPVVFDPVGVGATAFRRATATSECFLYLCSVEVKCPCDDDCVGHSATGRVAADGD